MLSKEKIQVALVLNPVTQAICRNDVIGVPAIALTLLFASAVCAGNDGPKVSIEELRERETAQIQSIDGLPSSKALQELSRRFTI